MTSLFGSLRAIDYSQDKIYFDSGNRIEVKDSKLLINGYHSCCLFTEMFENEDFVGIRYPNGSCLVVHKRFNRVLNFVDPYARYVGKDTICRWKISPNRRVFTHCNSLGYTDYWVTEEKMYSKSSGKKTEISLRDAPDIVAQALAKELSAEIVDGSHTLGDIMFDKYACTKNKLSEKEQSLRFCTATVLGDEVFQKLARDPVFKLPVFPKEAPQLTAMLCFRKRGALPLPKELIFLVVGASWRNNKN